MIFKNPRLSDISPKIELFFGQIVGRSLPKNFDLSISGNDLKVAFYQINYYPVKNSLAL